MSWTIATHHQPVWRSRANFIVAAKVDDTHWEQLWTQRLEHNQYLICCIPFFVYDLALGDVVSTQPRDSKQYVVEQVVNPSSHFTFRVWFEGVTDQSVREDVRAFLIHEGCASEWWSNDLLAIDAADSDVAQRVANYLHEEEKLGHFSFETGLLHGR